MIVSKFEDLDLDKIYTYADYLLWKFEERLELIKGKVFRMSPAPSRTHQKISTNFNRYLSTFFYDKTCEFYSAPFDVRLAAKDKSDKEITTVVQPDLCVICNLDKLDERGCQGAPDFIIEIASPGNSKKELRTKFKLYEENGVKEYWVVNSAEKNIQIFFLENGIFVFKGYFFDSDDITPLLFSDLKIKLEDIFK
ncbi:MAG: Uma2 family endonuclease [Cruoricaptor ignavus]|nr:Uma2 family endonuclease [Cruoricaptor ignavus]